MAGPAHPQAMSPSNPGRTRTAPPQRPDTWPGSPRTRLYLLFGATGLLYLLATRQLFSRLAWKRLHVPLAAGVFLLVAAPWHVLAVLWNPLVPAPCVSLAPVRWMD